MDYPNRGTLWTNDYKKTDIQPDLKGDIKLEFDLVRDMLENADTDHIVIKLGLLILAELFKTCIPV